MAMTSSEKLQIIKDTQYNCDVSDARDHGIYSMCSMILKLRNLYKWEYHIEPWSEPEPSDLLDWVDDKEKFWEQLSGDEFRYLTILGKKILPHEIEAVNDVLSAENLFYGAGHGRSMKAVFFIADILEKRELDGISVYILGNEKAKEMASPIALVQDGTIVVKKDSLRYFLWDQFQEMRSSVKSSSRFLLDHYGLRKNGGLDHNALRLKLDDIVSDQLNLFIYHEVGETLETRLNSHLFQKLVGRFPSSVIEFVCRAVRDVLADTHPHGLLAYAIRDRNDASLGMYLSFLDGLRETLFPEIKLCWESFENGVDWSAIETARSQGRTRLQGVASEIEAIAHLVESESEKQILARFTHRILEPLGLDGAVSQEGQG